MVRDVCFTEHTLRFDNLKRFCVFDGFGCCLLLLLHFQVLGERNLVQLVKLLLGLSFEVVGQALFVLSRELAVLADHLCNARALLHDPRHLPLGLAALCVPRLGLLGVRLGVRLSMAGLGVSRARLFRGNHCRSKFSCQTSLGTRLCFLYMHTKIVIAPKLGATKQKRLSVN